MYKRIISVLFLQTLPILAIAAGGSYGVIDRVYYNSDGKTYISLESGNNTTDCYNSGVYGSHRIDQSDPMYDQKMSMILVAFSTKKKIQLQDTTPNGAEAYCDVDIIYIDQ